MYEPIYGILGVLNPNMTLVLPDWLIFFRKRIIAHYSSSSVPDWPDLFQACIMSWDALDLTHRNYFSWAITCCKAKVP